MKPHDLQCECAGCLFERHVAKVHREFSRGLMTPTEYAERLTAMSQEFLASQVTSGLGS